RDAHRNFPAIGDEYFLEHGRDPLAWTPGKILARRFHPPLGPRGFTVESWRERFRMLRAMAWNSWHLAGKQL
ncbi:MAG: hypothetical protein ACRD52_02920, partial [Candidatus Acidiferrales bacterium]